MNSDTMLPQVRVVDDRDTPAPEELTTRKAAPGVESEKKRHQVAADIENVNSGVKLKVNTKLEGKSKSK
jgi:hypothetical protein